MTSGRPTKYLKKYNEQARKLCLLGYTDKELADFFEVSESTLNLWKKEYPKFSESIKSGKELADVEVVDSLRNRALGYSHKEEKIFNDNGKVTRVQTTKHYPPDPTSAIFWLKNRQRSKWTDEKKVELEVKKKIEDLFVDD